MKTFQTILNPTDFSEASEEAGRVARKIARDYGGRVVLLHVPEPPPLVSYGELERVLEPVGGYRQVIQEKLDLMTAADDEDRTSWHIEEGPVVATILKVALEQGCDLIVMGTHGRRGISRLILGSVAESVLRQAPCPVLTVRPTLAGVAAVDKATPELARANH